MEALFSMRSKLKELYRTNAVQMTIGFRVVLMVVALFVINNCVGTIALLKNPLVTIIIGAFAGILPVTFGITVLAVVALSHIFKISMIIAGICAVIFLLVGILSMRLAPGRNIVGLGSFVIAGMGASYAVPVIMVVLSTIMGVIPMLGGLGIYRIISLLKASATAMKDMTFVEAGLDFLNTLMADQYLIVLLVVSMIAYLLGVSLKSSPINESWKVGIAAAVVVTVTGMFAGTFVSAAQVSISTLIIYSIVGLVVALVIEIFIHNVDYRATEELQFEDDEYFYYVKAIPKKEADQSDILGNSKRGQRATTRSNTRTTTREASKTGARPTGRDDKSRETRAVGQRASTNKNTRNAKQGGSGKNKTKNKNGRKR